MRPAVALSEVLAGATGLEPAASCVTGRRSNQLNYAPAKESLATCNVFYCLPVLYSALHVIICRDRTSNICISNDLEDDDGAKTIEICEPGRCCGSRYTVPSGVVVQHFSVLIRPSPFLDNFRLATNRELAVGKTLRRFRTNPTVNFC